MNFLLSDDQVALVDSVSAHLRDKCEPLRVHKIFDMPGAAQFDADLWQSLCEMGVPAIMVPEDHGGLGLGLVDLAIVAEVLGKAAAPVPFLGHALAALAIALAGSAAQKSRWLPLLVTGEVLATVALCEGRSGWMPDAWTMTNTS
ncbi:MAG: acyl-CoA dehydrogenase family protein, partial [Sphingomonas sp.]